MALIKVSPSKLGTWQDCPRKFYFQYIQRVRVPGSWAHFSMGNAVHNALRDWFASPRESTPDDAAALVKYHWQDGGFADAEQSQAIRDRTAAQTRSYCQTVDTEVDVHSRERTVTMRTDQIIISGRVDRLDQTAEGLQVIDYKTGRQPPAEDDARGSMALALYAASVQAMFKQPCTQVSLHHIPSASLAHWRHSDQALARQIQRAESLAAEFTAAQRGLESGAPLDLTFAATPSKLCQWCDYWSMCPAGQDVGPMHPRWQAVVD